MCERAILTVLMIQKLEGSGKTEHGTLSSKWVALRIKKRTVWKSKRTFKQYVFVASIGYIFIQGYSREYRILMGCFSHSVENLYKIMRSVKVFTKLPGGMNEIDLL